MAYRFKLDEPIEKGFRRIGVEQIERARALQEKSETRASAIHETRKCMKRVRALLRLVRPGLGDDVFRRENARFRDIAMRMSAARDGHVLLETVMKLEPHVQTGSTGFVESLRRELQGQMQDEEKAAAVLGAEIASIPGLLAEAANSFEELSLEPGGLAVVLDGLETTYRRGRHAFEAAYEEATDEAFHELRKEVQRHWRHMQLLGRAWPEMFEARAGASRRLSQILGDDHDLSLLVSYLSGPMASHLPEGEAHRFAQSARERQDRLRAEAGPRVEQLLATRASAFRNEIGAIWKAARKIAQLPGEDEAG